MTNDQISVFGLGYVGLSTAVCLASRRIKVLAVDIDESKVGQINNGRSPIYEPGLEELLSKSVSNGFLTATHEHEKAVLNTTVSFVTVGTPSRSDDSIDLNHVEKASKQIGQDLRKKQDWHLVVIRSTVIPGTCGQLVKSALESASLKRCGVDLGLCMNPEFLREGMAIQDTFNPDRVIIGQHDQRSGEHLESIYRRFYGKNVPPMLRMSLVNAELTKYANNAFLGMKVSYINMIANLCQRIPGADVTQVADAIGLDKRIGRQFLNAGLGYGGSCFPKDLKALRSLAEKIGVDLSLVDATIKTNDLQPLKAVEMTRNLVGDVRNKRIAILGLSFKPDTDDVREAVSMKIIQHLLKMGGRVVGYDPVAVNNARKILGDSITYASSALECLREADVCIVATEWEEFKRLRPEDFLKSMRNPAVVDGRRIYDPKDFERKVKFSAIGLNT